MFIHTRFREPSLSSASQAGMVNSLNDGLACGLFPVMSAATGLSIARIGVVARPVPRCVGARAADQRHAADRIGRKR